MRRVQITIALLLTLLACSAQLSIRHPAYIAALLKPASGGSAPAAPSALVVNSVGASGVSLGWTDNSANETGFWVEYDDNGGGWFSWNEFGAGTSDLNPTAASVVAYSATTADSPGGSHASLSYLKYRVKSTNSFGASAYSAEAQVQPSVAVADLDGLENGSDVDLTWTDTAENTTGTKVYRSTNSGMSYSFIATTAASAGTYTDSGVLGSFALAVLRYYVVIENSGGSGPNSNVATPHP